jgi:hypothetical protein
MDEENPTRDATQGPEGSPDAVDPTPHEHASVEVESAADPGEPASMDMAPAATSTPSDEVPSDEVPSDEVPSDEVPSDEVPSDEVPGGEDAVVPPEHTTETELHVPGDTGAHRASPAPGREGADPTTDAPAELTDDSDGASDSDTLGTSAPDTAGTATPTQDADAPEEPAESLDGADTRAGTPVESADRAGQAQPSSPADTEPAPGGAGPVDDGAVADEGMALDDSSPAEIGGTGDGSDLLVPPDGAHLEPDDSDLLMSNADVHLGSFRPRRPLAVDAVPVSELHSFDDEIAEPREQPRSSDDTSVPGTGPMPVGWMPTPPEPPAPEVEVARSGDHGPARRKILVIAGLVALALLGGTAAVGMMLGDDVPSSPTSAKYAESTGVTSYPDGSFLWADGTRIAADGTVTWPDGSTTKAIDVLDDGSIVYEMDGAIVTLRPPAPGSAPSGAPGGSFGGDNNSPGGGATSGGGTSGGEWVPQPGGSSGGEWVPQPGGSSGGEWVPQPGGSSGGEWVPQPGGSSGGEWVPQPGGSSGGEWVPQPGGSSGGEWVPLPGGDSGGEWVPQP